MRHIGTIQNTGSRVVVVFLQLPEASHKCLIMQLDSLPDYYREVVNRLLHSDEAQTAVEFYEVLARNKAEGVHKDMLQILHEAGQLVAMPIDNILMNPAPNTAIPLRDVLSAIGRTISPRGEVSDQYAQPKKFNQFEQNQQADLDKNRHLIAQSKLRQAEVLEADARRYRLEAYAIEPSLRPTAAAPTHIASTVTNDGITTQQLNELADIASSYGDAAPQLDLFEGNPNA